MNPKDIKEKIEANLVGSKVTIYDPYNDGVHLKAKIIYNGFAGMTVIEQHKMVYKILKSDFEHNLHALNLETSLA